MKDKEFEIFGSTYKIKYVDRVETDINGESCYVSGLFNPDTNIISISLKNNDGSPKSKDEIEITLYHECIHAILTSGQYLEYCENEPLVEWVARCVKALKKQKIW